MLMKMTLALLGTIVIELGVLLLLGENRRRVLWSSVVVNALTNVPLNLYLLNVNGGWGALCVGEILVVLVETVWYWLFVHEVKMALVYSVLCNAISFLIGMLFQLVWQLAF